MELVAIVIVLALVEFMGFSIAVGRARARYDVHAPATTGHPEFERYFRVHMNTLEQLVIVIPAMVIYAHFGNATIAAAAGLVFVISRLLYFRGYVADPKKRSLGFGVGWLATAFLMAAALVSAIMSLL
ncbi:MAG: MAPEG family protein [Gammaproteobacteria bacterium]|nr:MAPEG family protein [Gammaproteobacteria bacterium]